MGHLTHTPTLTENSIQVKKKKRDRGLTAVVQWSKKIKKKKKKNFANFFKYEKDFKGTYNIYKLLKQCWKYNSDFS